MKVESRSQMISQFRVKQLNAMKLGRQHLEAGYCVSRKLVKVKKSGRSARKEPKDSARKKGHTL